MFYFAFCFSFNTYLLWIISFLNYCNKMVINTDKYLVTKMFRKGNQFMVYLRKLGFSTRKGLMQYMVSKVLFLSSKNQLLWMARYGLAEKCVYTHLKMHLSLADKRQKSSSKRRSSSNRVSSK